MPLPEVIAFSAAARRSARGGRGRYATKSANDARRFGGRRSISFLSLRRSPTVLMLKSYAIGPARGRVHCLSVHADRYGDAIAFDSAALRRVEPARDQEWHSIAAARRQLSGR